MTMQEGVIKAEGFFQNKVSTALPGPPQIFAHFTLCPSQQKQAKKHQTLLTGDRLINFRKVAESKNELRLCFLVLPL